VKKTVEKYIWVIRSSQKGKKPNFSVGRGLQIHVQNILKASICSAAFHRRFDFFFFLLRQKK